MFFLSLCVFFSSFLVTFFIIIFEKYHAKYTTDVEHGVQKFHFLPVPRIGGIPLYASFALGILFLVFFPLGNTEFLSFKKIFLLVTLPIFFVGILEDITKQITPLSRIIIIFLSSMLVFLGLNIQWQSISIHVLDNFILQYQLVSLVLTVVFFSSITNGFNMIDGFHGLMLGYSIMALIVLAIISFSVNDILCFHIVLIILSSILGVFFFNFPFGRIFSGDSGAYFLGFVISVLSVYITQAHSTVSGVFPLALLSYPSWEVFFFCYS